jgi:hypothetical protein
MPQRWGLGAKCLHVDIERCNKKGLPKSAPFRVNASYRTSFTVLVTNASDPLLASPVE